MSVMEKEGHLVCVTSKAGGSFCCPVFSSYISPVVPFMSEVGAGAGFEPRQQLLSALADPGTAIREALCLRKIRQLSRAGSRKQIKLPLLIKLGRIFGSDDDLNIPSVCLS